MVILKELLNHQEVILVSSTIVKHCSFLLHAFITDKAQQENSISYIQDLQKFVSNHQSSLNNVNGLTNQMEQLYHYSEQLQEMSQSVRQQASNSINLY